MLLISRISMVIMVRGKMVNRSLKTKLPMGILWELLLILLATFLSVQSESVQHNIRVVGAVPTGTDSVELGHIPGSDCYRDLHLCIKIPGVTVFSCPLYFANTEGFVRPLSELGNVSNWSIASLIKNQSSSQMSRARQCLVLEFSSVMFMDSVSIKALKKALKCFIECARATQLSGTCGDSWKPAVIFQQTKGWLVVGIRGASCQACWELRLTKTCKGAQQY
ncbi:hypothetical protein DPEC_G00001690 [Dallia pectoralis]|uniref:Uncharacterized protein n=1 Tax=Dallia pectoralis TaxID=75939 RepID=A0ACC2HJ88_DALPE|nr:hypothetical protein DPEC_G00001690 [Dallia pectoralis]